MAHKTNFISLLIGVPRLYSYTLYNFGNSVHFYLLSLPYLSCNRWVTALSDTPHLEVISGSAIGLVSFLLFEISGDKLQTLS